MPLELGRPLVDLATGEARFRLVELLARGENYDIALGQDLHLDDKRVAIKAIRYREPRDAAEVAARRATLREELTTLTLPFSLLPEPLDWLVIENRADFPHDPVLARSEPLLVYELQHGEPMRTRLASASEGIEPDRALRMVRELALFLRGLHEHGRIFRTLSPDHVIVDLDDIIHTIGCSGVCRIGQLPLAHDLLRDDPYVAPELREARDPRYVAPAADIYSLGALLTCLLTGRAPLRVIESPFDDLAFHRLGQHGPGLARLVARMMQPNPAKRFASIDALLPLLDPRALPAPGHPELAGVELPSPWRESSPAQPPSSLSPGPLVSVPRSQAQPPAAPPADTPPAPVEDAPDSPLARRYRMIAIGLGSAAVVSLLVVVLLALLR